MTITKHSAGILTVAFAVLAMAAFAFILVPKAQAADLDGGYSYDYFVPDMGSSYDYYVPDYGGGSSYDYYVSDYSDGFSYDYFVPDYSGYSDFASYGGGMGGWSMPFSTLGRGGNYMSQSSTNVNTNTNACTSGSCNTNINAPTNIVTSNPAPAQTVVYATPSYPTYPTYPTYPVYPPQPPQYDMCPNIAGIQSTLPAGYYIQNGNCFWYSQPSQPYVTLSAVPYTGFEMGPVATALYWSFLVLWCLIAAYLIVVKKVQNKIAAYFFGTTDTAHVAHSAPVAHATHAHAAHAPKVTSPVQVQAQFDGIDPFIASQIARSSK